MSLFFLQIKKSIKQRKSPQFTCQIMNTFHNFLRRVAGKLEGISKKLYDEAKTIVSDHEFRRFQSC